MDTMSQGEALQHIKTLIKVALESDNLENVRTLLLNMEVIVKKATTKPTMPVYAMKEKP